MGVKAVIGTKTEMVTKVVPVVTKTVNLEMDEDTARTLFAALYTTVPFYNQAAGNQRISKLADAIENALGFCSVSTAKAELEELHKL